MRRFTSLLVGAALCSCGVMTTENPEIGEYCASDCLEQEDYLEGEPEWLIAQRLDEDAEQSGEATGSLEVTLNDQTTYLRLEQLRIDVRPAGHMAHVEVEHIFDNPTESVLEGTFRFLLPRGAIVTGLDMEIGGEMMTGEVLSREKAQQIYRQIVDEMRDPAILEWEQGQNFKLRVFPIEANSKKRIRLQYYVDTVIDSKLGEERRYLNYPAFGAQMQQSLDRLEVSVDGKMWKHMARVGVTEKLKIPLPQEWGDSQISYSDKEGERYLSLRIAPRWNEFTQPAVQAGPRRVVLLLDTSRSMLEEWPRLIESVDALLARLDDSDEVAVVLSDVTSNPLFAGTKRADSETRQAIHHKLQEVEPDGASDLAAAFRSVETLLGHDDRRTEVVYIGDGTPTWGELSPEVLMTQARSSFGQAPVHSLLLGSGADRSVMSKVSGINAGRVVQATTTHDATRFATFVHFHSQMRAVKDVQIEVPGLSEILISAETTLFEGEVLKVFGRGEIQVLPSRAILRGQVKGRRIEQEFELTTSRVDRGVDKQYAFQKIAALQIETDGSTKEKTKRKDTIVTMSESFGVLSRHTAFLVLESDEAYKQHQIERRREAEKQGLPAISGRDLNSTGQQTSLTPGDIQPGDPEILIPAPRHAQGVTVVFAFGETKRAHWDADAGVWMVRFLVDEGTPAGTYEVRIRIQHQDGRAEYTTASYTVDMRAPEVDVKVFPMASRPGVFRVFASQVLGEQDRERGRRGGDTRFVDNEVANAFDAKKVEVTMPDGQVLRLRKGMDGRFVRTWEPKDTGSLSWPLQLDVAATDSALNVGRRTVSVIEESPR